MDDRSATYIKKLPCLFICCYSSIQKEINDPITLVFLHIMQSLCLTHFSISICTIFTAFIFRVVFKNKSQSAASKLNILSVISPGH